MALPDELTVTSVKIFVVFRDELSREIDDILFWGNFTNNPFSLFKVGTYLFTLVVIPELGKAFPYAPLASVRSIVSSVPEGVIVLTLLKILFSPTPYPMISPGFIPINDWPPLLTVDIPSAAVRDVIVTSSISLGISKDFKEESVLKFPVISVFSWLKDKILLVSNTSTDLIDLDNSVTDPLISNCSSFIKVPEVWVTLTTAVLSPAETVYPLAPLDFPTI